ncbi:MAG TPA: gamma-glutamyltransferase [Gemmataceae bacterium]|nr:gamma-glutamyltransferase [Gemmataceae bacterium]
MTLHPLCKRQILSSRKPAHFAIIAGVLGSLIGVQPPLLQAKDNAIEAEQGMVVSVSPPGTDVGVEILKKGGNAVDAAVATAFALAVTYPAAGNIGGGGFMLVYPGGKTEPVVIDYRETAPAAASKTMFSKNDSYYGYKVIGVPGTVRGLGLAHRRLGKLPWKDVVWPAVRLAQEGFVIDASLASSLNSIVSSASDFPELCRVLGKKNGKESWKVGDRLTQPDLAETLRQISDNGPDTFYTGPIAGKIVAEMKAGGGLITQADLSGYQAQARAPIHGTYRGFDVYAPPPPSSGGICLVEMLNILENYDLRAQGRWSPETLHVMIEAMRRAFCDRARFLGDPDFVATPPRLTTKEYARELAQHIDLHKATPSEALAQDIRLAREGDSTTHFSIIDKDGMAVSNTYTLERSYGSRVMVRGAGFLLNDEMMDFNWQPGITDRKGGIGTPPNQIAPGKRMLSSQTPTIVAKNRKVILVTGSPGSRTIINTVLCVLVNVIDFNMDIRSAVDAPRLHHSWFPDEVRFEATAEYASVMERLRKMGHTVVGTRQGDAHSIWVDPKTGRYYGAADHRIDGKAAGF